MIRDRVNLKTYMILFFDSLQNLSHLLIELLQMTQLMDSKYASMSEYCKTVISSNKYFWLEIHLERLVSSQDESEEGCCALLTFYCLLGKKLLKGC
jgi:hypothetical protein